MEHVIPVSWILSEEGKKMEYWFEPNLLALCFDCNNSRGNEEVQVDDYYIYLTNKARVKLFDFIARYKKGLYYWMLA